MSDLVGNPEDRFSRVAAHISHAMRQPDFCKYAKTKTQLSSAVSNQRLCFCFMDSSIHPFKSEISSFQDFLCDCTGPDNQSSSYAAHMLAGITKPAFRMSKMKKKIKNIFHSNSCTWFRLASQFFY